MNRTLTRRQFIARSATTAASLAVAGSGLFTGCGDKNDKKGRDVGAGISSLAMQAAWVNDAEFSGYFVAIDKGWYRELGLDLVYKPGGPDVIPEGTLLAKKADLALTTPDTTVNLILKEGAPLKIIGTQYQKSPLGIVSLTKSNINSPRDLIGKTLAVPPVNLLSVDALLKINNVPKNQVKIVPYQYDPLPLIKGEVDATVDFTTNVPFTIQQKGAMPHSFLMYDWGFTIYNDTVVVLEETLHKKRSDLVKWLRASRRGWIENLADPYKYPPTFANTHFKDTGRTIDNEKYFNNAQKPLIESASGIFSMSEDGIQANIKALREIGLSATRDMFVTDLIDEI